MTSDSNDAEQRFCTECGHQLEYGVRFCTECGAALTTEPAQKATPVPLTNTPGPNRVVVIGGAVLVVGRVPVML